MNQIEIDRLIQKSLTEELTKEEKIELLVWLGENDDHKRMYAAVRDVQALTVALNAKKAVSRARHREWWRIAAACIGFSLAIWGLYTLIGRENDRVSTVATAEDEIRLISAGLTYTITADSATEKVVEQQQLLQIVPSDHQQFNRLIVPRGKVFSVRLCDGTVVRLNSMSELRFPSEFVGDKRSVELTGEAFFDVARDTACPFVVTTENSTVCVVGTQFNVAAYAGDEQETVSLLEGCVETIAMGQQMELMPGEQVTVITGIQEMKKSVFNPEEVMAWMDGFFFFEDQPLDVVLKTVGRWYQVEFKFAEEELKEMKVYVRMRREKPIEDLFRALEATGKISFDNAEGASPVIIKKERMK